MPHRFIRDGFLARMIYHLSGHKYFKHPDEEPDYVVPEHYYPGYYDKLRATSADDNLADFQGRDVLDQSSSDQLSSDIKAEKEGLIIVDWEGADDPDNPRNWTWYEKAFFIFEISFLTSSVYMASAVYTPGVMQMKQELGFTSVEASLGVFLFVLGYGLGPLIWSPMSENAIFGRTSIYVVTLFIFVILQIPTALAKNVGGFLVVRFLGGFFASPCLATGGASVGDVTHPWNLPVALAVWSIGAVAGPSMGPFFGSILTVKGGWRWCFWFIMIVAGFSLFFLTFMLPETYAPTLLTRKAKRLRAKTGNDKIVSRGMLENQGKTFKEIAIETLWRPVEITILEPVVLLIDIYIAMVYSILYLFFEVFPIYFIETKHFTIIEMGVCYISILVGVSISCSFYIPLIRRAFTKPILAKETIYPEVFIPLAIVGGSFLTAGLFIFGWSATSFTHWIGPLIGIATIGFGTFLIFQTLFNYMGASFKPEYLASVFASNDLVRSSVASVFPIFGAALFNNLATERFPVAWGMSLIGFIALAMILIPILFYLNGPKLRARSKYARG